ncbi:unnamed protein product [Polarella glacialis]|uniref:SAM domain-containing protein n=1 Tax=Polarella glacialis TaxID=89957 RepID=A0A813FNP1_POLGL|nr:unnamed protein product [Polarella glacialis]
MARVACRSGATRMSFGGCANCQLSSYVAAFRRSSVSGAMLLLLDEAALGELGIRQKIERLRILGEINKLRSIAQSTQAISPLGHSVRLLPGPQAAPRHNNNSRL